MISGKIDAHFEPVIRLRVYGPSATYVHIDAVIDTGFNGSLTLPPLLIAQLRLPWQMRGSATVADGRTQAVDIYAGVLDWDGAPHPVLVESADATPLVGMNLLRGYRLQIDVKVAGEVRIEALP